MDMNTLLGQMKKSAELLKVAYNNYAISLDELNTSKFELNSEVANLYENNRIKGTNEQKRNAEAFGKTKHLHEKVNEAQLKFQKAKSDLEYYKNLMEIWKTASFLFRQEGGEQIEPIRENRIR